MVAGLSTSFPFRVSYKEDDVSQFRPQRVGGLAGHALLAQGVAVIANNHE